MTTSHHIDVAGLSVEVVRKDIKNMHLATYPPTGRVRVSVPHHVDDERVRMVVASRLGWIRRRQQAFAQQERQTTRELVSGESHYVVGRRHLLDVIETTGRQSVRLRNNTTLELRVKQGSDRGSRDALLQQWYRRLLSDRLTELIPRWEPVIGVDVAEWRIKRMKTRWGTCNPVARRIWLNLELAKKPPSCLEFVVVHEMVHLLERRHNDRFRELMDRFMPQWRLHRDALNRAPLGHHDWGY